MTELEKAFEILGIAPGSSEAAVKKAWRALVRTYHPDMAKTDLKAANQRLADINAAFDAVSTCSSEEIDMLRQAAARKARAKERAMRARNARRRAEQEAAQSKTTMPTVCPAKDSASETSSPNSQHANRGQRRRPTLARSILSDLAQEAFAAARKSCSPQLMQTGSSIYL